MGEECEFVREDFDKKENGSAGGKKERIELLENVWQKRELI